MRSSSAAGAIAAISATFEATGSRIRRPAVTASRCAEGGRDLTSQLLGAGERRLRVDEHDRDPGLAQLLDTSRGPIVPSVITRRRPQGEHRLGVDRVPAAS